MEVTTANYKEILEELHTVIEKATFLAIDGEFTGLKTAVVKNSPFDMPEEYYEKMLQGSVDFLLCQLGLSVFTFNNESGRYSQRSYNFYVFPRPYNTGSPDCRFMCQASSISFLTEQGFDFNKLFRYGIPYLTATDEEELQKRLEERNENRSDNGVIISKKDQPRIDEICQKISDFLQTDAEELVVPYCNSFIRRLVYKEARQRWPDEIKLDHRDTNIVVKRKGTVEEEEQIAIERKQKEKEGLKDAVGLSTLMRMIADSGKLVVGHNMLFDLFHIVHQFFAKLPTSYVEFKALLHSLFPRILDTKIICQSNQFRDILQSSNLNDLLETVSKPPFCIPEVDTVQNYSYTICADKTHEAGYDAYITGLCFISLLNYLGSMENPPITTVLPDSPLVEPFMSKLLIGRLKDIPYINLTGDDPIPSRINVYHLTFPPTWSYNELNQLFKPFGDIQIGWINDTSAYVKVFNLRNLPMVNKMLKGNSEYTIQSFKKLLDSRRRRSSNNGNGSPKAQTTSTAGSPSSNNVPDAEGWETAGKRGRKRRGAPVDSQPVKKVFQENDNW